LVCKVKLDRKGKVHHIWIREIRTGLAENVILWCDDELFMAGEKQHTPGAELIQFIQAHGF
jgi:hypothetical protein